MCFHKFFHYQFQQICIISVSDDFMHCISEICQIVASISLTQTISQIFLCKFLAVFCHLKPLCTSHDNFGLNSSAQDLSPNNFTSFEGSPDRRKNLFSCRYCGKRFKSQSDTSRHERLHTGEKPFSCLYCPEKFSRSDNLKNHAMKHKGKLFCIMICLKFAFSKWKRYVLLVFEHKK